MTEEKLRKLLNGVQKPGRYTGGELNSVIKDKNNIDVRFAFCFPDTYEIGMSHLGMKILYSLINNLEWAWCERVFAPWVDMEKNMIESDTGTFALESLDDINEFDIIGFTLQYELCYTNMLNMLAMSKIPLFSKDRQSLHNLVVVGGPCTCNAEPIADFIDVAFLGEGEEQMVEFLKLYRESKLAGDSKSEFLRKAAKIQGVYVPAFYDVEYNADGTVKSVTAKNDAPMPITKAIVEDMDWKTGSIVFRENE